MRKLLDAILLWLGFGQEQDLQPTPEKVDRSLFRSSYNFAADFHKRLVAHNQKINKFYRQRPRPWRVR